MPEISAIIPCYNAAEYINEAVDSLLSQMCKGDELIVVDDGSTDDTRERLAGHIRDGRIRYVYQDNAGVSAARNHGARLASNVYLYFLDADDRVLSHGLGKLREAAEKNSDCAMVFGGHVTMQDSGKQRARQQKEIGCDCRQNFIDYVIDKRFSIANGGAVLIKRDIVLQYPYPESLKVSEDFCHYAWVLASYPCCSFPEPVVEVRKHAGSLRNQLAYYQQAVERLPDVLFDPDKLPETLLKYQQAFICNRLLSLFRAQYLAGEIAKSRETYWKALKCRPQNILKISYLRKYMRALVS